MDAALAEFYPVYGRSKGKIEGPSALTVDGKQLVLAIAVSREKAADIVAERREQRKNKETRKEIRKSEAEAEDKRNLRLASVGYISPQQCKELGLSKGDINKREAAVNEKRIKLKNPNYFVSPVRLCIRNLPITMDEKTLKKLFVANGRVGNKSPEVTFVKIARDKNRLDKNGMPRSKGFGFGTFDSHDAAISALQKMNNMSTPPFSKNKRAIVEFSVENSYAASKMKYSLIFFILMNFYFETYYIVSYNLVCLLYLTFYFLFNSIQSSSILSHLFNFFFRELIEKAEKVKAENKAKGISSKKRKWEKRVQKFIARRKERQAQRANTQEAEGAASQETSKGSIPTASTEPTAVPPTKKQKLEAKSE